MARKKDTEASKSEPTGGVSGKGAELPAGKRLARTVALWGIVAALGATAASLGYGKLKRHVEARYATPAVAPVVVLKDRPVWMNDFLAERITAVARPGRRGSAFDHDLLKDVHDQLLSDPDVAPWIEKINRVRRVYAGGPGDTIEVDATFRAPVALVKWENTFWLVDSKGVKLPEQFDVQQVPRVVLGQDGKLVIRVINGVRRTPPDPGVQWKGEDLQAGLELLKFIYDKPCAQDIVQIDVSNFDGRRDRAAPHLTLVTRFQTEIRWGRPVSSKDYFVEVSPARKLEYLDKIMTDFGQVDAKRPWIDIRFDRVTYPKPSVATTAPPTTSADTR